MSAPSPPPSANRSAITARGGSIRVGGHTFVVRQRQHLRPSAVWRNPGCLSRRHCSCQTTLSLTTAHMCIPARYPFEIVSAQSTSSTVIRRSVELSSTVLSCPCAVR
jgi:hypothetical protein